MENMGLMSREELIELIEEQCPRLRTAPAMADVVIYVHKAGGNVSTSEIKENVEGATDTVIRNAVEKVPLLEKFKPTGGKNFFLHARVDQIYFSPSEITEEGYRSMKQDLEMLLEDARSDPEKLDLLADKFGSDATFRGVEEKAMNAFKSDPLDCMQTAGDAIQTIKQSRQFERNGDYDEMGWRRRPNRYGVGEYVFKHSEEA
jgi:hypothetical protein